MPSRVNIVDGSRITDFLKEVAGGDAAIARLLEITLLPSLKRREESAVEMTALPEDASDWLKAKWEACGPFHEFRPDGALRQKVGHIRDWLASAREGGEEFLSGLDGKGRPKKLVQLDLEGAFNAAEKYFRRLNQQFHDAATDDAGLQTVMRFDNGYRIVRLESRNAMRAEGAAMGHCVGGGYHEVRMEAGTGEYYSLRDPSNRPHVTFELERAGQNLLSFDAISPEDQDKPLLLECKGKQNRPPAEKYLRMAQEFIIKNQCVLIEETCFTGLVRDVRGAYHRLDALPEGLEIAGDLDLSDTSSVETLPKGVKVGGHLILERSGVTSLSEGLEVGGSLVLQSCNVTALPEGLKVGMLDLADTHVTALPAGLVVENALTLSNSFVTDLPPGLKVGSIDLNGSLVTALPENMQVRTSLNLNDTAVTTLSRGLKVGDNLYMEGSQVAALPEELKVGWDLHLPASITSLPEGLRVGRDIIHPELGLFTNPVVALVALEKKFGKAKKKAPGF